jgi:outer membrane protein TolC
MSEYINSVSAIYLPENGCRMNLNSFFVTFVSCTFVCSSLLAEVPKALTLYDSIKINQDQSPQVRKAEAFKEEARWKKAEAFSIFLPKLTAGAQHLIDNKFMVEKISIGGSATTIELIQPYTVWSLRGEWMVFDGFANYDSYKAQTLAASALEKEADWMRFQLKEEVKLKFYKALAAVELEKVSNQNVKTLSDHLDKAKALRQSGIGTNFDVLRVEVQLNEARSEKLSSEDNVVLAKQLLLNTLGLEDEGHTLTGTLPVPATEKISVMEKPAASERLDYQALTDRELSAHKAHLAAYKHWMPKISLVGQADYYNNVTKGIYDQDYNNAYTLGVNLSWNLFDGFASSARAAQADAKQVQAIQITRQALLKNKYDFDFWKRRYLYSASIFKAKMDDVEKAQESVRLATQSLKAGTRTSSEVLDAELDLFRARAGVVNAQINAVEALVNLELALGKEL